jgi:hypothetical protein
MESQDSKIENKLEQRKARTTCLSTISFSAKAIFTLIAKGLSPKTQ